tara:strand:+ start:124 stop:672 length:549 start_codon:yes stop_codon:yes gene_type:complete
MNKFIITILTLFMFFFNNLSHAKYETTFFDYKIKDISGNIINLSDYKNKVVLIVNTASFCGFTNQYNQLQELWTKFKSKDFILLGIPSNSFNQEKESNEEVKEFCEINFSIDFPLTAISVVKGENAHDIYKWARKNHGKSAIPKWNFYKILIDKNGKVAETYSSLTKPMSKKIITKIESLLD